MRLAKLPSPRKLSIVPEVIQQPIQVIWVQQSLVILNDFAIRDLPKFTRADCDVRRPLSTSREDVFIGGFASVVKNHHGYGG